MELQVKFQVFYMHAVNFKKLCTQGFDVKHSRKIARDCMRLHAYTANQNSEIQHFSEIHVLKINIFLFKTVT